MLPPKILLISAVALFSALAPALAQDGTSTRPGIGAYPYDETNGDYGVTFRVWAPNADSVHVAGTFNFWSTTSRPLFVEADGYWSVDVPFVQPGSQYQFIIRNGDETLWRNDARATLVTNSVGVSVVHDPNSFEWPATDFVTPLANDLVIYEMHIGTFGTTPGDSSVGTIVKATERLDYLASLGISAIELMPFFEFPGDYSWGYNPSHCYAVEEAYGTPDEFKHFVSEAHARGIAVLGDLVFSHIGPSDMPLWQYDGWSQDKGGGIYFYNDERANTPWGDTRPDFREDQVRRWVRDNVFHWLDQYHFDGIRFDGTKYIRLSDPPRGELPEGWSFLQWVNDEIDTFAPWKFSIAEDMDSDEWLTKTTGEGGAGFDSQWDPMFYPPIRWAVEATWDDQRSMWSVRDAINFTYNSNPMQRIIYTESHDEVANGRSRVPEEIWPGNADSWYSKKRSTLGAGVVFTTPGIPMLFQGQEFLEDGWFSAEDPLDWTKAETFSGITALYTRLINLRRNTTGVTAGLRGSNLNIHHVNDYDKVIAWHRWDQGGEGDDVIVIANFANTTWDKYRIGFPHSGTWHVHFNSDDTEYDEAYDGFGGQDIETESVSWDGMSQSAHLSIAPYTMLIFSQKQEDPAGLVGDINDDGLVDGADLTILLGQWGNSGSADLDGSGAVDGADLTMLLGNWTSG